MEWLVNLLSVAFAVWLGAMIMPGVTVKHFRAALWVAILLAIVNVTIGWLLRLITTSFNWLTLGLVHFIISVLMLMLVDKLATNFKIKNFWWATLLALFIAAFTGLVDWIL
jgi:putative membrane protein